MNSRFFLHQVTRLRHEPVLSNTLETIQNHARMKVKFLLSQFE